MTLNDYISKRYDRWLDYATYHCHASGLSIEPAEVLNDVLCGLLSRSPLRLEMLMQCARDGYTELDFFVLSIIKRNIISPRSSFRYKQAQHCTYSVDWSEEHPEPRVDIDDLNLDECYQIVSDTLDELELPKRDRIIFEWKFFDGRPYSEWPGPESQKCLYNKFDKIFFALSSKIREKIGE